jgi:hypothetical protein
MTVRVQVFGHPRVLHPTGAFLHPRPEPESNPRRTGFGCGFYFSPVGAPETRKNRNLKETWKKTRKKQKNPRNPKKLEKTQNPKQTRKIPERNPKKPEKLRKKHIYKTRRTHEPCLKYDGFGCQISPAGSGVKFNPTRTIDIPSAYLPWKYVSLAACLG